MLRLPIGCEMFTVREPFAENPEETLKKVKEIGYDGVEFFNSNYSFEAARLKAALEENQLDCYGILTGWDMLRPEKLESTLRYNEELGNKNIAIGSLKKELVADKKTLYECIDYFNELLVILNKAGFSMGYHNHKEDFFNVVEGKTVWDHVFENTPKEFNMVLDTGNALAAHVHSVDIIKKYPGRQPWVHIKPCSHTKGFNGYGGTMIGEDDFDWPELIKTCVELGGTQVLTIEYGNRFCYQPYYGAYLAYNRLKEIMEQL